MMIEQPLDYDDVSDHVELQQAIDTPICLDESIHTVRIARDAIAAEACRIINIKPGRVGGHRESIRLHDLCAASGIPVWHGGMLETGIGRAHNIHLASLPNFPLPGDIAASKRYYEPDLIEPAIEVARTAPSRCRPAPASASGSFASASSTPRERHLVVDARDVAMIEAAGRGRSGRRARDVRLRPEAAPPVVAPTPPQPTFEQKMAGFCGSEDQRLGARAPPPVRTWSTMLRRPARRTCRRRAPRSPPDALRGRRRRCAPLSAMLATERRSGSPADGGVRAGAHRRRQPPPTRSPPRSPIPIRSCRVARPKRWA